MNPFVPIILIGVMIVIALILILVERLLGSKGDKMLLVNNEKVIPVKEDDTILNLLTKHKIFVPSACGGKATCGFCKVRLLDGGGDIKPTEEPFLSPTEKAEGVRLSCQVKVKDDVKIEIPKEMLNAKEYMTTVSYIEDLTYDIKLVRFRLADGDTMPFKPGQYAQLKVPGIDVIRAYSIASHPKNQS